MDRFELEIIDNFEAKPSGKCYVRSFLPAAFTVLFTSTARVRKIRLYDIFSASESPQKKNASNKTIAFCVAVDADFADFKSMSHQYD